ncbi:hypothetical protein [Bradyrhizobium elkanii]
MLDEQVPGVRGDLVPLERAVLGMERLHLGGELARHLGRDFQWLSGYRHARKIGIRGRFYESGEQVFAGLGHPHERSALVVLEIGDYTGLIRSFSLRLMSISARRLANSGSLVRTVLSIVWPSISMTTSN